MSIDFNDIVLLSPIDPITQWRVGNVGVTKITETEMRRSVAASLPNADAERLARLPWLDGEFAITDGTVRFSFHAVVIDTGSHRIIVDTCFGNDKRRPGMAYCDGLSLPFLARLEEAGYPREAIDFVVSTHFHSDHIGWNTTWTDTEWKPTFPKATYLFAAAELAYWSQSRANSADSTDPMVAAYEDSVLPVQRAGLVRAGSGNDRICDEVRLLPTPGHTPGHVSVVIESRGESALITGDTIHHPGQLADPTWGTGFDADPTLAVRTRRTLLTTAAENATLVIGTHWSSASRIARDGDAFRLAN